MELGRQAASLAEEGREMALGSEPGPSRDLADGIIGGAQQILRALKSPADDILMRRLAGRFAEAPGESESAQIGCGRDRLERQVLAQVRLDVLQRGA